MSHKAQPDVSIIIPTYNEADRIVGNLNQLAQYVKALPYTFEIIVSDAQSPDGTTKLAKSVAKQNSLVRVVDAGPKQGKGKNVAEGLKAATGKYHVFMDADLATPLHHLQPLLAHLIAGADVVIAERVLSKIHTGIRLVISVVANILVRVIALPGVMDSQCGFKGFTAQASKLVVAKQTIFGWGFDIEYLLILRRAKMRLAVVHADDWYDPKISDEGMVSESPSKAAIKTFAELIKIKINDIKGLYR